MATFDCWNPLTLLLLLVLQSLFLSLAFPLGQDIRVLGQGLIVKPQAFYEWFKEFGNILVYLLHVCAGLVSSLFHRQVEQT